MCVYKYVRASVSVRACVFCVYFCACLCKYVIKGGSGDGHQRQCELVSVYVCSGRQERWLSMCLRVRCGSVSCLQM